MRWFHLVLALIFCVNSGIVFQEEARAQSATEDSATTGEQAATYYNGEAVTANDWLLPCGDAGYGGNCTTSTSTATDNSGTNETNSNDEGECMGYQDCADENNADTPPFTGVSTDNTGANQGSAACPPGTSPEGGTCIPSVNLPRGEATGRFGKVLALPYLCLAGPIICVLSTFMNWLLAILGIVAVIAFVIAGLQYLLAFGQPKAMESAKNTMLGAIIGIVVALSGVIVILSVDMLLRGY